MNKICTYARRTVLAALSMALPLAAFAAGWVFLCAQLGAAPGRSFADMSIEQLMNESVTSVSKRETKLSQSPAAITMVTQDEIHRFGATSLPEALRLVPGMDVARISNNEWAVSARGFNNQFANMLLVLIDGRTVYTPASGGVFWNAQDVVFADLDRIEVIRGPGATLWGTNAVNGVINITTRSAKETQGGLVSTAIGTEEQPAATVRYGGRLAPNLYYRVYAKYFNRDGLGTSSDLGASDDWNTLRTGFRVDGEAFKSDNLTLQGDYYEGDAGKRVNHVSLLPVAMRPATVVSHNRGGNALGRWTRTFSEASALTVQAYYDHVEQGDGFGMELRDTYDFDLQHRLPLGASHDVVWGAGYRLATVRNTPSFNLTWTPARERFGLFNVFVQDDITLVRDRLHFTGGVKIEDDKFTALRTQPSVRLLWTPTERQTLWAAASRAHRAPALFERKARLNVAAFQPAPASPAFLVSFFGNTKLKAEKLTAYEVGYRIESTERLSFDFAGYYNKYEDVLELVAEPAPRFEASPFPPHLLLGSTFQNALAGETFGAELSSQWRPTDRLRIAGSYTWLRMHLRPDSSPEDNSPRNQFQIRSSFELSHHWELSSAASYVDPVMPQTGETRTRIPSYTRFDLGVSWRPSPALEIGVWGQNLFDRRHAEFGSQQSSFLTEIPRSVTARVILKF